MKRLGVWIRNLEMKKKILLLYASALLIALLLLLLVLRGALGRILFSHECTIREDALNQSIAQLESQISEAINLSNVIYNNDTLISACNVEYAEDYFKMYLAYSNVIQPELYKYRLLLPSVTAVRIYTGCDLFLRKGQVESLEDLKEYSWFAEIEGEKSIQWVIEETDDTKELGCVRMLPRIPAYPYENYLYLELDSDYFFSCLETVSQDSYGLLVTDDKNNPLYCLNLDSDETLWEEWLKDGREQTEKKYGDRCAFLSGTVAQAGWQVFYCCPTDAISKTADQTVFTTFFLIAVCFSVLLFLTFFLMNTLLRPLRQLTEAFDRISLEDIGKEDLIPMPERRDEIGKLCRNFNEMMKRIRLLIDRSYVAELKTREYQLKALRSQINPHFLYNTLSLISARAVIAEQTEISQTVYLLTQFYRTTLNKGQDMTDIQSEFENIQAYISLQLILTNHSFEVRYHLDETLFDRIIPCLILQPIVENALEHALRNSRKPEKILVITLDSCEGGSRIMIEDNGCGIPPEILRNIFSLETEHIGIKNVNERLKLLYGENRGLQIESQEGVGTRVTIRIPRQV